MLTRSQSFNTLEICEIIIHNLPEWKTVKPNQIELTKLTGLTNVTYKAEITSNQLKAYITPNTVIFRQQQFQIKHNFNRFGEAEGFVVKDLEKYIFSQIGNMDIGPKELACGNKWRIEEFIFDGTHPTPQEQIDPTFQFNFMGVVQQFHQMNIPLPNQNSSTILEKAFSNDLKLNVLNKISMDHLYTEEEITILEEIKEIVESEEQQKLLKSFIDTDSDDVFEDKLVFCHNDMNHLNIFSTPKAGREIVLIDYDYCSYNYPTFDIANFLNESSINYLHPVEPFYELVQDNVSTSTELHFIVLCYILHQILEANEIQQIKQLLQAYPNANKDKFELKFFQQQVEDVVRIQYNNEMQIKELRQRIKFLKKRIRRFQIISNYNWILWSVMQAKNPEIQFEHIAYGKLRLDLYKDGLNKEIAKINKKMGVSYLEEFQETQKVQQSTSSDSDEQ